MIKGVDNVEIYKYIKARVSSRDEWWNWYYFGYCISHRVLWSGWLKGGPVITDIKPECLLIRGGKDNI